MIAWFKERWLWLCASVLPMWLAAVALWDKFMGVMREGVSDITTQLASITAMISVDHGPLITYLQYANAFMPLNEAFVMATAWLGLKLLCVVVRLVKGAIPTYG